MIDSFLEFIFSKKSDSKSEKNEKDIQALAKPKAHSSRNKAIGAKGERLACEYLMEHGYRILEQNISFSRDCEIDIIALDENELVFVEVKTRTTANYGSGFEAITKKKYSNIQKGVFKYLEKNKKFKKFRIDVISIILKPEVKIEQLKNV